MNAQLQEHRTTYPPTNRLLTVQPATIWLEILTVLAFIYRGILWHVFYHTDLSRQDKLHQWKLSFMLEDLECCSKPLMFRLYSSLTIFKPLLFQLSTFTLAATDKLAVLASIN